MNFELEELEAKQRYEKAKSDLQLWDEIQAKKLVYKKELESLRSKGITVAKAKELVKDLYCYNKTKRKTLENELEKALERYSLFDPKINNYIKTFKVRHKQMSSNVFENIDALFDVDKIEHCIWHQWPEQIKISGISYSRNDQMGIGAGEAWLANIFGGKLQGCHASFDIMMPNGSLWEVKQLLEKTDSIRIGTEGLRTFEEIFNRLKTVMKQLNEFVCFAKRLDIKQKLPIHNAAQLAYLEQFIDDEFDLIVKNGEISINRLRSIRAVLIVAQQLRSELIDGSSKFSVSLGDKTFVVDKSIYIDIMKRCSNDHSLFGLEDIDFVLSMLSDNAFKEAKTFFNDWVSSIKVENVFSQIDGVFIVNPKCFMAIPKEKLETAMKFERISQGKPKFTLSIFE